MDWFALAFVSAILSAAAAVFQKKVLFTLDALEFSFALSIFNVIFALPFLISFDQSTITFQNLSILYFKTILGTIAFWNVMLAIKNLEISESLPLMVLTPGIVAISAFIFLGESLGGSEIWGMVLLLAGTYIIEMRKGKSILTPFTVFFQSRKHYYIVFALILFTMTSILDKSLLVNYKLSPKEFLFFQQLFWLFNFSILVIFLRGNPWRTIKNIRFVDMRWIVWIAVFTIGYRYTQIEATKLGAVAMVLSVKRLSVFFATIIGGKLFNEHNLIRKTVATIILLIGAYIIFANTP